MKNKEKFEKEILDVVAQFLAVTNDGKPVDCYDIDCKECKFCNTVCTTESRANTIEAVKEWLEQEYIEKGLFVPKYGEKYYTVMVDDSGQFRTIDKIALFNSDRSEFYHKYFGCQLFRTEKECLEYIDFWRKVDERRKPFVEGMYNAYFIIDPEGQIKTIYDVSKRSTKYYFGELLQKDEDELIAYLGEDNIKKFMFEVYE